MVLNKPSGNMYPWAYTWNPLGGRCPHECRYCYVERLRRRGVKKYAQEPFLDEKAFKDNLVVPKGFLVFVESCGDLFADEIPATWIWRVLNYIGKFPETTFLLQSKNPKRFFEFNIPQNCILGTTLETNRDLSNFTKAPNPKERFQIFFELNCQRDMEGNKIYHLMVSVEPVMDFDLDELLFWIQEIEPEFVSIGADSGKNNLPEPTVEKIQEFIECLKFTEIKVKKNLRRFS